MVLKLFFLLAFITMVSADFKGDCLRAHNQYRAKHSANALKLDRTLQNAAQNWANELARTGAFKHSDRDGENIFNWPGRASVKAQEAVDYWYNEVNLYDWDNPGYTDETGHFTQLVWRATTKLGCAVARDQVRNQVFVVANYDPPGNYPGKFEENVLPN